MSGENGNEDTCLKVTKGKNQKVLIVLISKQSKFKMTIKELASRC